MDVDNDAKSATRTERYFGFGQISKNFIYINVRTGITADFVVNGRQIGGSHCNVGKIGYTQVFNAITAGWMWIARDV